MITAARVSAAGQVLGAAREPVSIRTMRKPMTKYAILAVDPGLTSGVTMFNLDENKNFVSVENMTQVQLKDLPVWLGNLTKTYPDVEFIKVVYEKFITYRQYAQRQVGSKQPASQAIGMLKMWAVANGIEQEDIIEQPADVLQIAKKWTGVNHKGPHSESHKFDAFNHGYYYMVKNDMAPTALEGEINGTS